MQKVNDLLITCRSELNLLGVDNLISLKRVIAKVCSDDPQAASNIQNEVNNTFALHHTHPEVTFKTPFL
uniref:Uncharacterized protein n=1 Tax=Arundo donax TaxID=35708 RepID=A0A0A9U299_ARUDO